MIGSRPLRDYFSRPRSCTILRPTLLSGLISPRTWVTYVLVLNKLRRDLELWQRRCKDLWSCRDEVSVLLVRHHLDADMAMPDHGDCDLDRLEMEGIRCKTLTYCSSGVAGISG
ncbi:uncharacterized protein BCR38DRAFT_196304 [Pseudomassariella vexata]|uniref:Uncharacterized protein n=1 Tax=Pseudomassariella vexata TaxID=1141098 RepID=A0A1Y2E1F9_9PEZI|nr:uncharacterized protein BCR38DRAFT_196304 [Pseudomassariella vexata]ORY65383.1 hypothetical protein BCR38DRAFT_196304 [Pseudomassariella vexata]